MTDTLTRRAGRFAAVVLAADSVCHLYWLTGATWPFPDERTLSLAVLGLQAPFTARILIPLAVLLAVAAGALWRRLRFVAIVVAVAAAVQVPVRIAWAFGLGGGDAGPLFPWLNVMIYLPACALLALAAYRVARSGRTRS
ncbi:MAG TPA: hypothetical protein VL738_28915 [Dactylosporangium sp.]|nr:hypothetical protein [Dactylosporangium sp.]